MVTRTDSSGRVFTHSRAHQFLLEQHVKLLVLAPGALLCCTGCPTPSDSFRLLSDSICYSHASPAQGHRAKRLCLLLALQGPLDPH